jgi:putative membrane protein
MADYYLLLKALHIIAVLCWMAGMFYLPRLFVYHADAKVGSELDQTLQVMERRLLRVIMNPAMIATVILGLLLAMVLGKPGLGAWFHGKMAVVAGLIGLHMVFARWRREFAEGRNQRSAFFYRVTNEVGTVLAVIAIFLVVYKPA